MFVNKLPMQLKQGDKVALVAPASGQKQEYVHWVNTAVELLQRWGLEVIIQPIFDRHSGYLACADERRANHLISALTHPEIRAVFVTRGGYGSARLLPFLEGVEIPSPRFLVGFSDITTLHLHFAHEPKVINLHAPNLSTAQILGGGSESENNANTLKVCLFFGQLPHFSFAPLNPVAQALPFWQFSHEKKTGGCLSLLVTSLATPHEIETEGKIVMIEEVGESPYKVDRMLTHLKNAGKFDRVKAVIFGEMGSCCSPNITIAGVLADFFADASFPVYSCPDFGHGNINFPWMYVQ